MSAYVVDTETTGEEVNPEVIELAVDPYVKEACRRALEGRLA